MTDSTLYTQSDDYWFARQKIEDDSRGRLLAVVSRLFGEVTVRLMADYEKDMLVEAISYHGDKMAKLTEAHYVNEGGREARQSVANILKATLGAAEGEGRR